jgi:hypothetical protein
MSKEQRLYDLCKRFIKDNRISCPETICQVDSVIVNASDFIEQVCDIVGYHEDEEIVYKEIDFS